MTWGSSEGNQRPFLEGFRMISLKIFLTSSRSIRESSGIIHLPIFFQIFTGPRETGRREGGFQESSQMRCPAPFIENGFKSGCAAKLCARFLGAPAGARDQPETWGSQDSGYIVGDIRDMCRYHTSAAQEHEIMCARASRVRTRKHVDQQEHVDGCKYS